MKLDIINFNPYVEQDKESINNIINMFNIMNENISSSKYIAYQNILNKINRFLVMLGPIFEKELQEAEQITSFFTEETNEDDNISISSISEYENDFGEDEEDIRDIKNIEIELKDKFKKTLYRIQNDTYETDEMNETNYVEF
jgi:hypothetical protein